MSSVEKIVFYGYVFTNSQGNYEAYVPQKDEHYSLETTKTAESLVDDPNFVADCEKESKKALSQRHVMLVSIENKPAIGDRVDSGKYTGVFGTLFSKISHLKPIGKFGLDEYYQLSGRCTLVTLDQDEQTLTPAQLIKKSERGLSRIQKSAPSRVVKKY